MAYTLILIVREKLRIEKRGVLGRSKKEL